MSAKKPKDIKLSKILTEQSINLELKGSDKKKIIAELVKLIAKSKKLRNKKAFYKAVMEREKLGSTGIGNGVAIPHAKSAWVKGFALAFARDNEGIDFGALDGEKTYLFFAFASPKNEVETHLKILAEISRLVKDKFVVERLRRARDKKEVLRIISTTKSA